MSVRGHDEARQREEAVRPSPSLTADAEPAAVLQLQQSAGNAAVTGLIQRDAASPWMTMRPSTPTPNLRLDPDYVARQNEETKAKIRAYLDPQRERIQGLAVSGWSMAELVDLVRQNVPESTGLAPEQIATILRGWSQVAILEHRINPDQKGADSEALATIKNALGKIPTELKLEHKGAFAKVSLSGAEAGFEKDEDTKATVGTESGKDVAVNLAAKGVHFAGKIEPGSGKDPTKWELGITFPGDDMVPLIPTLGSVFGQANGSLNRAIPDALAGRASVGSLKQQFQPVKEAVESLSGIAGHSGVSIGVKVEGEGAEIKATATLTVAF